MLLLPRHRHQQQAFTLLTGLLLLLFSFSTPSSWHLPGYNRVSLAFTGFYWVLLGYYRVLLLPRHRHQQQAFTLATYRASFIIIIFSMGSSWDLTGYNRVSLGFTGSYWVLLGFTGFNWVLLGTTGFY